MSRNEQTLLEDVAFLRALAAGGALGTARLGAVLLTIGLVFGLVAIQYWVVEAGPVLVPSGVEAWLWLDGLIPFLLIIALIQRRFRGLEPGPGSRALSAAFAGVGVALGVAALTLGLAGHQLGISKLAPWAFPIVLFSLFGAAWGVAYAVRRSASYAAFAVVSFLTAALCGLMVSRPEEWLVLAAGLVLVAALPGALMLRARPD